MYTEIFSFGTATENGRTFRSSNEHTFQTNLAPAGGTCNADASPSSEGLVFLVRISCRGYTDVDLPLQYSLTFNGKLRIQTIFLQTMYKVYCSIKVNCWKQDAARSGRFRSRSSSFEFRQTDPPSRSTWSSPSQTASSPRRRSRSNAITSSSRRKRQERTSRDRKRKRKRKKKWM